VSELLELAQSAVKRALELGASDAECSISESEEFCSSVRMRELERLKQAGSRGAGIRVMLGQRPGSCYTSDLSREGMDRMVRAALDLGRIATEDPHAGLPEAEELGQVGGDLQLWDPDIARMETGWKIEQAHRAEEAALARDPRIENSEGAWFDTHLGNRVFANSRGFAASYRTSSCGVTAVPVARENGSMERDYWHSAARQASRVESPELVGRRAAERALRRLNPRKAATQKAPVMFEARTARALLGELFDAVHGGAIYHRASFLAGKLGQKIAADRVTIIDDATMPGLFGSAPFDDEGVASRRTVVVEQGILSSYLLNTYTARKLGLKTTGNASRGVTGNAGVGPGNFHLAPGTKTEAEILAGVRHGLYVTELIGGGANTVTGDYSSGAAGLWIENGELAYPVSEITIAGNLLDMLSAIDEVASELEFRASIASPAVLIGEMTISGH
jgi:PmbA protein